MVEKESGAESERALIAGVFVNRLRKGMRLQSDPTVIYGLGASTTAHPHARPHDRHPYNTYTREGLPPTPIALAGRESLLAACSRRRPMHCTSWPPASATARTTSPRRSRSIIPRCNLSQQLRMPPRAAAAAGRAAPP